MRIDACLADYFSEFSRQQMQMAIENGCVAIDSKICTKSSKKVFSGQLVACQFDFSESLPDTSPEHIDFPVLYEDDHIIILNKPAGLVVHPGAGHPRHTLVNALAFHCPAILNVGEPDRPGIVHRLDAETSGIMLAAKTQQAYDALTPMFAEHAIHRTYQAICHAPKLSDAGSFDTYYGRNPHNRIKFTSKLENGTRRAHTDYRVLRRFHGDYALVECKLLTGRTHQVRVHLSENGAPILADALYSPLAYAKTKLIQRLALHSISISLNHPVTNQKLAFETQLPSDMQSALQKLHPVENA